MTHQTVLDCVMLLISSAIHSHDSYPATVHYICEDKKWGIFQQHEGFPDVKYSLSLSPSLIASLLSAAPTLSSPSSLPPSYLTYSD